MRRERPVWDLPSWWETFWFKPTPTSTLGVFRIAYGLVATAWTLSLAGDAVAFISRSGVVPDPPNYRFRVSLFAIVPDSKVWVLAVIGVLLISAIAVTVGYHSRLAAALCFFIQLSLQRRDPFFTNGGDVLLRIIALFVALAPSGAALSVDRWRKARDRFWECPPRAPWALRLIQIQVCILYVFAAWSKLQSPEWIDGTAVFQILRVGQYIRFDLPHAATEIVVLSNLATYGTLAIEASFPFLVWNRRLRPWILTAGLLMHLGIEVTMAHAFFGPAIMLSYIAFVPDDTMSRLLSSVRERLLRSRWTPFRTLAAASTATRPPVG